MGITDEEREALKKYTPEMALIVAFNPKDKSPDGKLEVLENGAHLTDSGLLDIAKNVGRTTVGCFDDKRLIEGQSKDSTDMGICLMFSNQIMRPQPRRYPCRRRDRA